MTEQRAGDVSKTFHADGLFRGAFLATKNAGEFLCDAVANFNAGRHRAALLLGVYCREEVGRCEILLGMRDEVLQTGAPVSIDKIKNRCEDHRKKLAEGQTGVTIRLGGGVGKQVEPLFKAKPGDRGLQQAYDASRDMAKRKLRRAPTDVHAARMTATYVDPTDTGGWSQPWEVDANDYRTLLGDIAGDYQWCSEQFSRNNDLTQAAANWKDRPQLPEAVWPEPPRPQVVHNARRT